MVKRGVADLANALPLSLLQKCSHQKIFLPFYHLVSDEPVFHIKHLYKVRSVRLFEADLAYLLRHFQPIDLPTLLAIQKGEKPLPKQPVMHLSFDDGLRECAEVVAPILLQKGIPATFFINAAFLDNKALMFRYKLSLCVQSLQDATAAQIAGELTPALETMGIPTDKPLTSTFLSLPYRESKLIDTLGLMLGQDFEGYLKTEKPYMSSEQVQGLLDSGFSIGSHSIDHPLYHQIELEEQLRQTIEAQRFLENNFKLAYRVFAFPFTDDGVRKAFFTRLFDGAYKFDLSFGGAGLKRDVIPQNLQRFPMESDQLLSARKSVNTEFLYYLLKAAFGKNQLKRKD